MNGDKLSGPGNSPEILRVGRLQEPIPQLDDARALKMGYRDYPIDADSEIYSEPVVPITSYDLAGQSYYSRFNPSTAGMLIGEVEPVPKLRESLAHRLSKIDKLLNSPSITEFFNGEVELFVEDGLRTVEFQKFLYEKAYPDLIKKTNPDINEADLLLRRSELVAPPSNDRLHPSPHATGGAVDVMIRYKQTDKTFKPGKGIDIGHKDGDVSTKVYPDFFEKPGLYGDELIYQKNRRAYYAIMTGQAFGFDSGLVNNPTEWWHWSYGDQMWAKLRNEPAAHYSLADTPR